MGGSQFTPEQKLLLMQMKAELARVLAQNNFGKDSIVTIVETVFKPVF